MIIASQKRKENIAEYILYMWQVEDIIRANDLDIDKIGKNVIDRFNLTDAQRTEMEQWYESLIDMMRREGVTEKGHLQINHNILNQLVQLHQRLLHIRNFRNTLRNSTAPSPSSSSCARRPAMPPWAK